MPCDPCLLGRRLQGRVSCELTVQQEGQARTWQKGTRHSRGWELAGDLGGWLDQDPTRGQDTGRQTWGRALPGTAKPRRPPRHAGRPCNSSCGHQLEGSQGWALEGGWPKLWMQGAQLWEPAGPNPPEGSILPGPLEDHAWLTLTSVAEQCGRLGHPLLAAWGTATGGATRAPKAL